MSGLKQLRTRMNTISSTMKITSAMKMISVSKLRQSHDALFRAYPYADEMNRMVRRLVRAASYRQEKLSEENKNETLSLPLLLTGRAEEKNFLIVAVMSDEGLCGVFNQTIIAKVEQMIDYLQQQDKKISLLCFGKRGGEILQRKHPEMTVHITPKRSDEELFAQAERLTYSLIDSFYAGVFDACAVVYSQFETAAVQKTTIDQIVPLQTFNRENRWQFLIDDKDPVYVKRDVLGQKKMAMQQTQLFSAIAGQNIRSPLGAIDAENLLKEGTRPADAYDYDPAEVAILEQVLPLYLQSYIYKVLLDTTASESASRMLAMDNASRNAGDMMTRLNKTYHRKRQELVTRDLIEVVSGFAEQGE